MSLSTLIVSEEPQVTEQIRSLVDQNNDLSLIEVSNRQEAANQIEASSPRVVWIELSPDPESGFNLFSSLQEKFPDLHYLISNVTLEADLVKRAMQIGAVDFLDSKTWNNQLPDVVSRVMAKEITVQREIQRKEKIQEVLNSQKHMKTTNPGLKSIRQKTGELDSVDMTSSSTIMGVVILLLLVAVFYFFFMPK